MNPFNVRCITHEDFMPDEPEVGGDRPKIGDTVTVIGVFKLRGVFFYHLEGYGARYVFDSRNFSTIPDMSDFEDAKEIGKADALFSALAETSDEGKPQDAFDRVSKGIENKLNRPQ